MRLLHTMAVLVELGDTVAQRMIRHYASGDTFHFSECARTGDMSHLHSRVVEPGYGALTNVHVLHREQCMHLVQFTYMRWQHNTVKAHHAEEHNIPSRPDLPSRH